MDPGLFPTLRSRVVKGLAATHRVEARATVRANGGMLLSMVAQNLLDQDQRDAVEEERGLPRTCWTTLEATEYFM